jgi:2-deoxy-D-gluconate 3-dehydrogenase
MTDTKGDAHIINKFDLAGQTAVVTGGAGLLGAEFCRTLAEAGAQVVIADINFNAASSLDEQLNDSGLTSAAFQVNTADPESVRQMVASTLETFGRLDILVNSAAQDPKFDVQHSSAADGEASNRVIPSEFESFPLDAWRAALETNLTGVYLCCQSAVKPMLTQGYGVIINISSIYGIAAPDQRIYQRPNNPPQYKPAYYPVTKAGILGFTRYLAAYYSGKNIRVNALTPGGVFNDHDQQFVQAYSARAILGRMAEKDEMNGALLFLASQASSYMTGANLVVDGGWTAW